VRHDLLDRDADARGRESGMMTLFNYLYLDAGNYKVRGSLMLSGFITAEQKGIVENSFEGGEFFIAEQVGIPPLQHILQQDFGGANSDDHCWHSFDGWTVCETQSDQSNVHDTVDAFVERFGSVQEWDENLSPNFDLAMG
jgi:hypothetical protein